METVTYHDGTTATGAAPLPKRSPAEQERDHICSLRRQLKFLESRAGDRHTAREIPALRFAIEALDCLPAAIAAAVAAEREARQEAQRRLEALQERINHADKEKAQAVDAERERCITALRIAREGYASEAVTGLPVLPQWRDRAIALIDAAIRGN